MNPSKVLLIYTGGTIGMNKNPLTGALEPFDFEHLLSKVPELNLFPTEIATYQFQPPIDSSDMSPDFWQKLAQIIVEHYDSYDGFVILHGTDTMAFTASVLSFMLEGLTKPVILTGSQLPIGQLRTDGKENVITSIEIAAAKRQDGSAKVPEVCVYFNGHLMRGNRTTKQSADGFNAFESFNYPHLADAGVEITYHDEYIHHPLHTPHSTLHSPHSTLHTPTLLTPLDSNVIIFSLFPGVREDIIRHVIVTPGLRSIVMRTYGSGNAPQSPWLISALKEAYRRGLIVINISQCLQGSVSMGRYDTGVQLQEAGVISGGDSTVEAAVTKLMYLQGKYDNSELVRKFMRQSICGEITL